MKMVNVLVLVSILVWSISSVQEVFAESGTEPIMAPAIKQDMATQGKDIITKRLESITKRLGLSAEQQVEIKSVLLDEAAKLKDLRANTNHTIAEKKEKTQELRDSTNSKIRSFLTTEQQIKHDELLKKISESRKNKDNKGSKVIPTN